MVGKHVSLPSLSTRRVHAASSEALGHAVAMWTVMVVTKENAAAHAFTKHIESLQLPPSIEEKFGRLVGVTELEKGPSSKTRLDVPPAFRNDVLRGKQVIIGCGGGFHQECSQPYSAVAKWMREVEMALTDEGQQYGNLDESSAIARVPHKGLVVWCGDHKQTPGGLRKSEEARAFRRKLMRRPIALRGDTKFIPPHMLGATVLPYVQDVPGPQVAGLRQLLQESTRQPLELSSTSVTVLQELCQETIGRCWDAVATPCCCAALAVLWLALAPEKFPLQADTFSSAAGTAGKQKRALILPSSARVSELTYVTIVGRYPELDTYQNDIIQFGNYLQGNKVPGVGFCPFFGMHRTAIFMPVLTLERWWTGSGASSRLQKKGTRTLQCYTIVTRWRSLCHHKMGGGLRCRCSLAQCHFLCRYDRSSCFAGTNQSRIPKWGTWEKFPSAHPTGAKCPKRRGLHYGLLEIWGLLQWT